MNDEHLKIRAIIVKACDAVGFPGLDPDTALTAWADDSLDPTLHRGSPRWRRAHGHTIAALEAATMGNYDATVQALTKARDIAKTIVPCNCPPNVPKHAIEGSLKKWCVVCGGSR